MHLIFLKVAYHRRGLSLIDTHILDKPSAMKSISFIPTTPLPIYTSVTRESRAYLSGRLLSSGAGNGLTISKFTTAGSPDSSDSGSSSWLAAKNVENVSVLLRKSLTELWLEPSEVKMKIRFGVAAFGAYPLAQDIDMKFFVEQQVPHLKSRFVTHLRPSPANMLDQITAALNARLDKTLIDQAPQLKFRNTSNVRVLTVTRKTIRPIMWGDWTIELRELGRWNEGLSQGSNIKTLNARPEHVAYTVSMYHENWKTRFSENPALDIGQRASWNPDDFIRGESESVEDTMAAVRHIQQIVDEVLAQGSMM
ncbi:hypothetical protein BGZ73_007270 [Actinomortierella ambigua]|nr:hypothetical protein BGZ73_007270 [Actinomortierella ambigua]